MSQIISGDNSVLIRLAFGSYDLPNNNNNNKNNNNNQLSVPELDFVSAKKLGTLPTLRGD